MRGGGGGGQTLRATLQTISLQNCFFESHTWRLVSRTALRELNVRWALPAYPNFEDEKSNGPDKKSVKQKTAVKQKISQAKDQQD